MIDRGWGAVRRTDRARQVVAARLLGVAVGDRIPTTSALADEAGVGIGTVTGVLRDLGEDGTVQVTTHGHQGSVLRDRDVLRLWDASGRGPLTGVLPLPQSREFAGVATAVSVLAEQAGLPVHLLYRQGATQRFTALASGRVDWVLASASAGRSAAVAGADLGQRVLRPNTYYGADAVVVITASGNRPRPTGKVAVDHASYDHVALTTAEFPDATLVEAPYLHVPEMVVAGEVDAAVWHRTSASPLLVASGLDLHPLRHRSPGEDPAATSAALHWRSDDVGVAAVLAAVLPSESLEQLQEEVVDGVRVPRY